MTPNTIHTPHDETDLVVDVAQLAAVMVLENGGETSRAEETATILCHAAGREEAEVIALPTGIFITAERQGGRKVSSAVRIKSRSINLYRVERVNALSRDFAAGKLTLASLHEKLLTLKQSILYRKPVICVAAGVSSAMFSLLFEEVLNVTVLFDLLVTFVCAFAAQALCMSSRLKNSYQFSVTFLASALIALLAVLLTALCGIGNLSVIIIGAMTPLLPGLSLTNAIRDTVMGDLVSGTVRIVETLLIAIGIAGGVGVVLAVYVNFAGGVL